MLATAQPDPAAGIPPERLADAGWQALADGFPTQAAQRFRDYLDQPPTGADVPAAALGLAQALCAGQDYAAADAVLDRYRRDAHGPAQRADFTLWKARVAAAQARWADALQLLADLPAAGLDAGREQDAWLLRVRGEYENGRPDAARKLAASGLATSTNLAPDRQVTLAGLLVLLDQRPEAESLLTGLADAMATPAGQQACWQLAQLAGEDGRPDVARTWLERLAVAAELQPGLRGEAWLGLAQLAAAETNWPAAVSNASRAVALEGEPEFEKRALLAHAQALINAGTLEEGVARLHDWISLHGGDPAAAAVQLRMAAQLLASGRGAAAIREYQFYLDAFADPAGRAAALSGKGMGLFLLERYAEAAAALDKAAALYTNPVEQAEALWRAADALFADRQFQGALEKYELARGRHAGLATAPRLLLQVAECQAQLGSQDAASATLRQVETEYSGSLWAEQAAFRRAALREELGDWTEALAIYDEILRGQTNGAAVCRAFQGRGLVRYRLGGFKEALGDFEQVIACQPRTPLAEQAHFMRGWCLYLMGEDQQALLLCRAFLKQYPQSPWAQEVNFWLAEYYYNHGDPAAAERWFARLAEQHPDAGLAPEALFWAGRSAMAQKQYLRAMEYFNKFSQAYPDHPRLAETRFAQGDVLTELGQFAGAILAFEEVRNKYPQGDLAAAAHGRIGDCKFTLGAEDPARYKEALAAYEEVLGRLDTPWAFKLQARYKIGRCKEQMNQPRAALEDYISVVYDFVNDPRPRDAAAALWFTRAAFAAGALEEGAGQWRQAVRIYQRVAQAEVPAAGEAQDRIRNVRLKKGELLK